MTSFVFNTLFSQQHKLLPPGDLCVLQSLGWVNQMGQEDSATSTNDIMGLNPGVLDGLDQVTGSRALIQPNLI